MVIKEASRILVALFGCLMCFASCQDVLHWQKLLPNGTVPNARKDAALGFDAEKRRVVLFGGRSNSQMYSDTWVFDMENITWKRVNETVVNAEALPGTRFGMVHGSGIGRFTIAFGSQGISASLSNDVFQYDFESTKWSRVMVKSGNAESRVFANGGILNGSLFASHGFGASNLLSDVVKLDLTKKSWESVHDDVNQYNPVLPHARYSHSSAILPGGAMIMFGGCLSEKSSAGPCPSSDSWWFDVTTKTWSRLNSCPSARTFSALALLPNSTATSAATILFGGKETSSQVIKVQGIERANELAIFDSTEKRWEYRAVQVDPRFGLPEPRFGHSMVTTADGVLLYGGASSRDGRILGDAWLLKGDINAMKQSPISRRSRGRSVNMILLHGIFMFVSWGILLQLSAFVARYMKDKATKWLIFHRSLAVSGLLLASVGFGLGVASFKGGHFSFAHGAIGLDIMLAGLYQPLNAAFRPDPPKDGEKPKLWRRIWEISHRFTGRIALLLAIANISLGLFLSLAPKAVWITWFAYIGIIMMIYVIAEIRLRTKMKTISIAEVGHDNIAM